MSAPENGVDNFPMADVPAPSSAPEPPGKGEEIVPATSSDITSSAKNPSAPDKGNDNVDASASDIIPSAKEVTDAASNASSTGALPATSPTSAGPESKPWEDFLPGDVCAFLEQNNILSLDDFIHMKRPIIAQELYIWSKKKDEVAISPLTWEDRISEWKLRVKKAGKDQPRKQALNPIVRERVEESGSKPTSPLKSHDAEKEKGAEIGNNKTGKKIKSRAKTELFGRKETSLSFKLVKSCTDLSSVLPKEECNVLGKQCWIFSVQQLQYVLSQSGSSSDVDNDSLTRAKLVQLIEEELTKSSRLSGGKSESDAQSSTDASKIIKEDVAKGLPMTIEQMQLTKGEAAEALVSSWEEKIEGLKTSENLEGADFSGWFPLNGLISFLFPSALCQVLKHAGITNAFDFLRAKKTESSLLVSVILLWREKVHLRSVKAAVISRFLAGISSRLSAAFSLPPVGDFERAWVNSNLIVLTGMGRDFIIGACRMRTDQEFLHKATKDMAELVALYRNKKGMAVLKGSGNVATISSWKSAVKEMVDMQEELIAEVDEIEIDAKKLIAAATATNTPVKNSELKKDNGKTAVTGNEIHSTKFLRKVLRPSQMKFLASVRIKTAHQLINAKTDASSDIALALIKWRRVKGFNEIQADASSFAIREWTKAAQYKLKAHGYDNMSVLPESAQSKIKRERDLGGELSIDVKAKMPPKRARNTLPQSTNADSETASPRSRNRETAPIDFTLDPIDALPRMAKKFLATEGITTAKKFLATKTGNLSNQFVQWRKVNGRSKLKGYGAVSILSGWKGKVRDRAISAGLSTLIEVDNATRGKAHYSSDDESDATGEDMKEKSGKTQSKRSSSAPLAHPRIMNGFLRRKLSVCGLGREPILYDFLLSVSKSSPNSDWSETDDYSIFLTYVGARVKKSNEAAPVVSSEPFPTSSKSLRVPILREHFSDDDRHLYSEDSHRTFCSLGNGMIDLSRFHVFPSSLNDRSKELQDTFGHFVLSKNSPRLHETEPPGISTPTSGNVQSVCNQETGEIRHLLFLADPTERGQTIRLYLSVSRAPGVPPEDEVALRLGIVQTIKSMSLDEIGVVLSHLENMAKRFSSQASSFVAEAESGGDRGDSEATHETIASTTSWESTVKGVAIVTVLHRMHFIAATMKDHIAMLLIEDADNSLSHKLSNRADKLLWQNVNVAGIDFCRRWNGGLLFNKLVKESKDEIMCLLVRKWGLNSICPLSKKLLANVVSIVACHILTTSTKRDSVYLQEALVENIIELAKDSEKAIKTHCDSKNDLEAIILQPNTTECFSSGPDLSMYPRHHVSSALDLNAFICSGLTENYGIDRISANGGFIVVKLTPPDSAPSSAILSFPSDWKNDGSGEILVQALSQDSSTTATKITIDRDWYTIHQLVETVDRVASVGLIKWTKSIVGGVELPLYSYAMLKRSVFGNNDTIPTPRNDGASGTGRMLHFIANCDGSMVSANRDDYHPKSLPFFLGALWPILEKQFRWRIHAGRTLSCVSFILPEALERKRRNVALGNILASKKRGLTSRRIKKARIPKLSRTLKHIFTAFTEKVASETEAPLASVIVKDAVRNFTETVECNDEKTTEVLHALGESTLSLFDEIIPLTALNKTSAFSSKATPGASRPCEKYGCEHLLCFVVMLPDMLAQCKLGYREQGQICLYLGGLVSFLSENHANLFDQTSNPPPEDSLGKDQTFPERMCHIVRQEQESSKDSNESAGDQSDLHALDLVAVMAEDASLLSEYNFATLEQTQICFARQADLDKGKKRAFKVGHPGLVCIHCLNAGEQSSRYFLGNKESLATVPASIYMHITVSCKHCPQEIKDDMIRKKSKHSAQMKLLKFGSQSKFFNALWARMMRLRRARIDGYVSDGIDDFDDNLQGKNSASSDAVEDAVSPEDNADDSEPVFYNHMEALAFLESKDSYQKPDVLAGIDLYYHFLKVGGEMWSTRTMPAKASSEWIFKKVLKEKKSHNDQNAEQSDKARGKRKMKPALTALEASQDWACDRCGKINSGKISRCGNPCWRWRGGIHPMSRMSGNKNEEKKIEDNKRQKKKKENSPQANEMGEGSARKKKGRHKKKKAVDLEDEIRQEAYFRQTDDWECDVCHKINPGKITRCGTPCFRWKGGRHPSSFKYRSLPNKFASRAGPSSPASPKIPKHRLMIDPSSQSNAKKRAKTDASPQQFYHASPEVKPQAENGATANGI